MVTQTPKALCYSPSRDLGGIFTRNFWNYCRNKLLKIFFLCCVIFTQFRWFAVDFYAFNCCLLMTKLRHALENNKITAVILTTWKVFIYPPPPIFKLYHLSYWNLILNHVCSIFLWGEGGGNINAVSLMSDGWRVLNCRMIYYQHLRRCFRNISITNEDKFP